PSAPPPHPLSTLPLHDALPICSMPLTKRQKEILTYLEQHIQEQGYAPSFEEIAERFAFQSLATVHEHLTNLERKGYIRRAYNERDRKSTRLNSSHGSISYAVFC